MRVALIGCSGAKLEHPARARDLYQGNLFRLSVSWVERRPSYRYWGILSAKHDLVLPDQRVEPYDLSLRTMSRDQLKAWSSSTCQQITNRWGAGTIYTALAGHDYVWGLQQMPLVEDLFGHWISWRKQVEKKRGRAGIGYLMQQLKLDRGR